MLVVIFLLTGSLLSEGKTSPFSMMLSKAEESAIKSAKKDSTNTVVSEFITPNASKDAYYLSAIIFVNQNRWTILLNDQVFQSDDQHAIPFKVKKVEPKSITISIQKRLVKVKINQTVDTTTGAVYDGDASSIGDAHVSVS